jgi:dimethylaniline monooxygenase (N-oxide forming)
LQLKDFYHGCVHTDRQHVFLIGFTRPIIGNIPSISEMQARYAVSVLCGSIQLPANVKEQQCKAWNALCAEYPAINTEHVYPVEQFPYCDELARAMGILPTPATLQSWHLWLKIMITPASTFHYVDQYFDRQSVAQQKTYMPTAILVLLALLRLFGYPLRLIKRLRMRR